jgi:cysteine desulfurase
VIYLDHHAATPLSPAVREAMAKAHGEAWANASSIHAAGRAARTLLEATRRELAAAIGAKAADIVLTGGATEACNLALRGVAEARPGPRRIVTTSVEHPAIAATCERLWQAGFELRTLEVLRGKPPTPKELELVLKGGATAVAVQWVNHETGTVFPIEGYAEVCLAAGVPLVVDGCQALGKLPVSIEKLGALVVSAAKHGGPAGAAGVWVDRGLEVAPVIQGGAQERGRRPGTLDVAAQAGFGAALRALPVRLADMPRLARLRDQLEAACLALGGVVNGEGPRVSTVTNVSFRGWRGTELVAALDLEGLCASSGAACSSGVGEPSPVLVAMYPEEPWRAESALRLSLGPEVSAEEVAEAIAILQRVVPRLLRNAP